MTWNANRPYDSEPIAEISDLGKSQRSSLATALERHFFWSDRTAVAGSQRTWDSSSIDSIPGVARALLGTVAPTPPAHNGTLFINSATSRLYALQNDTPVIIGSTRAVHGGHTSVEKSISNNVHYGYGFRRNSRWVVDIGTATLGPSDTEVSVSFNVSYDVPPVVHIAQAINRDDGSGGNTYQHAANSVTANDFDIERTFFGGGSAGTTIVMWRSIGTKTVGTLS